MPYDGALGVWKIPVDDERGIWLGFFQPESWEAAKAYTRDPSDPDGQRTWRGRPQARHFEVLYRMRDEAGLRYLVLYRFEQTFGDRDYGRILAPALAARWLRNEGYPLPVDLADRPSPDVPAPPAPPDAVPGATAPEARAAPPGGQRDPLTDVQRTVGEALAGRYATAKELALELAGTPTGEDLMRQRIKSIRERGHAIHHLPGFGYYRPDAPPGQPDRREPAVNPP